MSLELKPNELAVIRQVNLCIDGRPGVYARSIFPKSLVNRWGLELDHLGSQSLGDLLC